MGLCLCRRKSSREEAFPDSTRRNPRHRAMAQSLADNFNKVTYDTDMIDQLVLETLLLIPTLVDNDEEPPTPLIKLHFYADKEEGLIEIVNSIIRVTPIENPFGTSIITIFLDDCPLPTRHTIVKLTETFQLSAERALREKDNVRTERNTCVVLGCIAEKMAGPSSTSIFTSNTMEYLLTHIKLRHQPIIVMHAIIALEKFAQTSENKVAIQKRLMEEADHPLVALEGYYNHCDYEWKQVGFCAQWALDNVFIIEGRMLSYESINMTGINVVLNSHDVSEYLKISPYGLEARCDSYSFESVRCTYSVDKGCWYYECTLITPGVMQIGWATAASRFLNHDGYGIGDDTYSVSYDGCRRLLWFDAEPRDLEGSEHWRAGDTVGCLIDFKKSQIIFSLNGKRVVSFSAIFDVVKSGFFAAASFMLFQQCQFNFGNEPFKYPPLDRRFQTFNKHGTLLPDQKMILPKHICLEELKNIVVGDDSCILCYDNISRCKLEPCGHRGFCTTCILEIKTCPMCRSTIASIRIEDVNTLKEQN